MEKNTKKCWSCFSIAMRPTSKLTSLNSMVNLVTILSRKKIRLAIRTVYVTIHISICFTLQVARRTRNYTCQIAMISLCSMWREIKQWRLSVYFNVTASALSISLWYERESRRRKLKGIRTIYLTNFKSFNKWSLVVN